MHDRNRSLAVSLSALLLMGCASAPAKPPAPVAASAASSNVRLSPHEMFFSNLMVVVAAMGGNNPNPSGRAISARPVAARSCTSDHPIATAPVPDGNAAPVSPPEQTLVSASCQSIAATQ